MTGVWRRALVGMVVVCGISTIVSAQSDLCTLHYGAYSSGSVAVVPDAAGDLVLAFDANASESLVHADVFDDVHPPFAPPGGWFVSLAHPSDAGTYWGRVDSRFQDDNPGTKTIFNVLLHPRFSETAIDSVRLAWSGSCFTPPNVTGLSMMSCDSSEVLVADMTTTGSVGLGRGTSPTWDDESTCLAVAATDDLVASVKIFLQGPFDSGGMTVPATFSDQVPLNQPYSEALFSGTTLEHNVPQTAPAFPDNAIDWVVVALRSDESPESVVASSVHAAILLADGRIVEPDGSTLRFFAVAPDGYHLVMRHRNHIAVMSADTLDLSDGTGTWDFTTAMTQAYTDENAPMVALASGVFGLFAGDGSVDAQITAPDFNLWSAATTAGETGYRQSDYNMDGLVTAPDFNLWSANTTAGASSGVPD